MPYEQLPINNRIYKNSLMNKWWAEGQKPQCWLMLRETTTRNCSRLTYSLPCYDCQDSSNTNNTINHEEDLNPILLVSSTITLLTDFNIILKYFVKLYPTFHVFFKIFHQNYDICYEKLIQILTECKEIEFKPPQTLEGTEDL